MIPYPGCESAKVCPVCGQTRHTAQFAYLGNGRSGVCMFCSVQPSAAVAKMEPPKVAPDVRFGPTTRIGGSRVKFSVYADSVYQETVVCHATDAPYHRKRMLEKYAGEAIK